MTTKVRCAAHGGKVPVKFLREWKKKPICEDCIKKQNLKPEQFLMYKATKICSNCDSEKARWEFSRDGSWCKECHRNYAREYRKKQEHKEKHAAYMREWRKKKKHQSSTM